MNKSSSRDSGSSTQLDSVTSQPRFHSGSALRLDQSETTQSPQFYSSKSSPDWQGDNSRAIVAVHERTQTQCSLEQGKAPENVPSAMLFNRPTREDHQPSVTKVSPASGGGREDGGGGRSPSAEWSKREDMMRTAELGFRVSELVLCLISFSVMAADKTQGWSGDSFDRYREYRYCLSVNAIGFAYSGLQACSLVYQIASGKHRVNRPLRYHFDFFMDQVLAYLLISASSCAATRVDDWQSNWGKDEFTEKASASVGVSFLAFIAFAFSSLISGYNLCTRSTL